MNWYSFCKTIGYLEFFIYGLFHVNSNISPEDFPTALNSHPAHLLHGKINAQTIHHKIPCIIMINDKNRMAKISDEICTIINLFGDNVQSVRDIFTVNTPRVE